MHSPRHPGSLALRPSHIEAFCMHSASVSAALSFLQTFFSALFPFFLLSNCHAWHARLVACSCWVGQKLEALSPSALLLSPSLLETEIIACVISNYSPSLFSPVSVGTRSVSVQALISRGLPLAFHCILELMCCKSPGMICTAVFN